MSVAKILLVLDGWIHPSIRAQAELREILRAAAPAAACDEVATLAAAVARGLSGYAAVVLYFHHPGDSLSDDQVAALRDYVAGGGGLLAVHSATASHKAVLPYFEILGGRFTGHGPVARFTVQPAACAADPFETIAPFEIHDEIYLHELQPGLQVHFTAREGDADVPIVWTRRYGEGRVCYCGPGHRSETLRHPAVREILRRGFDWVRGRSPQNERRGSATR